MTETTASRGMARDKFSPTRQEYETGGVHDYGTSRHPRAGTTITDNEYAYVWDTSPCPHHNISVQEAQVFTTCPCMGESTYEKSTLSRKGPEGGCAPPTGPQYFEIDPEGAANKCLAGQVDLLQNEYESSLRRNAHFLKSKEKCDQDKLNELKKYHLSDGQLEISKPHSRSEEEESNKINTFLQHVTS